jgi:hypothetical protein
VPAKAFQLERDGVSFLTDFAKILIVLLVLIRASALSPTRSGGRSSSRLIGHRQTETTTRTIRRPADLFLRWRLASDTVWP